MGIGEQFEFEKTGRIEPGCMTVMRPARPEYTLTDEEIFLRLGKMFLGMNQFSDLPSSYFEAINSHPCSYSFYWFCEQGCPPRKFYVPPRPWKSSY